MGVNYKGAIENFNPYVQEIPIDAFVKTGMYKQQQEDAGIQRIQSTIDNVAGLDVANEGGKAYLNQRVNELTTSLNKYGFADVSDMNNVRNLQALATPIYQDQNIQKDVANTMQYRSLVKDQAEALKSGKAEDFSVAYENTERVQPWLNSKTAGETYTGGSTTLRGTVDAARKKFEDAFSKFKPNSLDKVDENGAYWVEDEHTYMDGDRLKRYVMSQMDAGDVELLKRSGWAKYGTMDDNTLKGATSNLYDQLYAREDTKVKKYNAELRLYKDGTPEWQAAKANVDYYIQSRDQYSGMKDKLASIPRLSKPDREALYQTIETQTFSDGLANAWSYDQVKRKLDINKVWEKVTTENGLNAREQVGNDNALMVAALNDGQILYDGTDASGKPKFKANPDYVYVPKGSKAAGKEKGAGAGDGSDGTDEILTVASADDKTVTDVNFDNIDGVTNSIAAQEGDFNRQMDEFLNQNGFEDLYDKQPDVVKSDDPSVLSGVVDAVGAIAQRGYDFNQKGVNNKTRLVVAKGKEEIRQHLLDNLTSLVQRVANGEDLSKSPEAQPGYDVSSNDTPAEALYKARFKKLQLDNFLAQPAMAKIVQAKTELNQTRSNWASVIRDQAMKTADSQDRRDQIKDLTDAQVLDYWNKDERTTHASDPYDTQKKGTDTHPSFHGFFDQKEVDRINAGLHNISTANQNRIITTVSDLQVKSNGELISIQHALFNKMFSTIKSSDGEALAFDPKSMQITGANILRDKSDFNKYDAELTVTYKKTKEGDAAAGEYVKKIKVNDLVDNNDDNNKIKALFRVADFGGEDLAARYAAGTNDNTLNKDGQPDPSKYMILTSQNKGARYFKIRYMDQDPANAQKQVGDISGEGREPDKTTTGADGKSTTTSYKTLADLTGGNSFSPGKAYIEELIPLGGGKFNRVIIRKPNSDQLFDFTSYSNARLYLKDVYENSSYWDTYHENRFLNKDKK